MGDGPRKALLDAVPEDHPSVAGVNFTGLALSTLEENIFERTHTAAHEQFESQPLVQARLLQTIADTARELGLLELALGPQEQELSPRRRVLGDDHPSTLNSINNIVFTRWATRLVRIRRVSAVAWEKCTPC